MFPVGNNCHPQEIDVSSLDGSSRRNVTSGSIDGDPVWSSDGSLIAFTRWVQGDTYIFVMSADGTGLRLLTHPIGGMDTSDFSDAYPSFRPVAK